MTPHSPFIRMHNLEILFTADKANNQDFSKDKAFQSLKLHITQKGYYLNTHLA